MKKGTSVGVGGGGGVLDTGHIGKSQKGKRIARKDSCRGSFITDTSVFLHWT